VPLSLQTHSSSSNLGAEFALIHALGGFDIDDFSEDGDDFDCELSNERGMGLGRKRRGPKGNTYYLNAMGEPLTKEGKPCKNCTAGRGCPYHNGCE
jgi:hypothetical protein